jgi:hypothetical protein
VKRIPTTGYRAEMQAGGDSNTQDEQHVHRAPTACNWGGMQAGGQNSNPQVKEDVRKAPKAGYWIGKQVVKTVTLRMNSMYRELQHANGMNAGSGTRW